MNGRFYNGDDDYDYHPYFGGGHPNLERGLIRRPKSPERPELPEYTKKYNRAMQAAKGQRAIDMKKAEAEHTHAKHQAELKYKETKLEADKVYYEEKKKAQDERFKDQQEKVDKHKEKIAEN